MGVEIVPATTSAPARRWKPYLAYKDSGVKWLGEVPEHWEVKKLKSICYMKGRIGWQGLKQSEFSTEGPYLITGMNFKDGVIRWEEVYHITEERYNEAPEIQLKVDDVLMTKDGTIGKLLYVDFLPDKASLNSHLLVLRPSKESFLPKYLYFLLQSDAFKVHIELYKTGTTFFGITQEAVSIFKMILPSINEQYTIARYLDDRMQKIDALISKKEHLIALLEEKRATLISSAVTKGLDPNAPMKDSGVEWLGEVPEHWDVKRLRFICKINPPKSEISRLPLDTFVSFLPMEMIDENGMLSLEETRTIEQVWQGFTYFKENDVLLAKITPCFENGKGAIGSNLLNGIGFGTTELHIIRSVESSNSRFIYYLTKSDSFRKVGKAMMYGAAGQQRVPEDFIKDFRVGLPPLPEQRAIASFLDRETARIDALISKVREGIGKLREYRTALISAAVTGKIDVREAVG